MSELVKRLGRARQVQLDPTEVPRREKGHPCETTPDWTPGNCRVKPRPDQNGHLPLVRCAAGHRNLAGRPSSRPPLYATESGAVTRRGAAERSTPFFTALTAQPRPVAFARLGLQPRRQRGPLRRRKRVRRGICPGGAARTVWRALGRP
jgi:hypothetical protein